MKRPQHGGTRARHMWLALRSSGRTRRLQTRAYESWPHAPPPPRALPSQYDRPKRFILIRHGESDGNVDEAAYVNTPDWKVGQMPPGSNTQIGEADERS